MPNRRPTFTAAYRAGRDGWPAGVDLQHRPGFLDSDLWADRGMDYLLSVEDARALRDALTEAIQEVELPAVMLADLGILDRPTGPVGSDGSPYIPDDPWTEDD